MYHQLDISKFKGEIVVIQKKPHETWDYLSHRLYGDSSFYKVIWQFNQIVDPNLPIYKLLQVNLIIPKDPIDALSFINSLS